MQTTAATKALKIGRKCLRSMLTLLLLPGEHDGSEDGYEDQDRGDLEGQEEFGEEDRAELGDVAYRVIEMTAEISSAEGFAFGEEDEAEKAEDGGGSGNSGDVGGSATGGSFLFARIEQHDNEDEEHHDGAGVDDYLGGGEELCPERPVEDCFL